VVTSNYPADFTSLGELFDLVLVDAPCSGEGMFRKDEVAVAEWSPENVEVCWKRQRNILTDIWPTLRPGGLLIYSTCTFNTQEDEENVRWMVDELDAELLPVSTEESWGITPSLVPGVEHAYRFLPGRTRGEGFFLAVLRKGGEPHPVCEEEPGGATMKRRSADKKAKGKQPMMAVPSECKSWLAASNYIYKVATDSVVAMPADMEPLVATLATRLHLVHYGIPLAIMKGRDAVPTHELAMSTALSAEAFARCELSYADALRYLHREAVTLAPDTPRGFVVVTYRGVPLGFVKNLGNRANNLYPNEWRIRSGYFPDEVVTVV
jgi:NOL1/NOP2/fmu family ribosome biogenesis protein